MSRFSDLPGSTPIPPSIVCDFLGFDLQLFNPLISALPRLLHPRGADDDGWIARFTRQARRRARGARIIPAVFNGNPMTTDRLRRPLSGVRQIEDREPSRGS